MKLFFVRHAAAIDRHSGISDGYRYLTPKGRIFFRETAHLLAQKTVHPDLILTSPLLRCVQTADILAERLMFTGPLEAVEELEPGFDSLLLRNVLDRYRQCRELVLVGHEPDLSSIVAELLGLQSSFNFKKGAAIKLKVEPTALPGSAVFRWLARGKELITSREEAFNTL